MRDRELFFLLRLFFFLLLFLLSHFRSHSSSLLQRAINSLFRCCSLFPIRNTMRQALLRSAAASTSER